MVPSDVAVCMNVPLMALMTSLFTSSQGGTCLLSAVAQAMKVHFSVGGILIYSHF